MDGDVLWLGLHKTGTTFLQKSLDLSAGELIRAGIAYVGLDEFHRRWTRPLLHDGHPDAPAPGALPEGMRRWLVFDENILALVQHGLTRNGFYPKAGPRARRIADHLGLRQPMIVLGLRGFAGMVPSLYCEALKSTPFKPFRSFLAQPPEAMSWLPLIAQLQAAFPASRVLLYCAEELAGREARLLARVTGLRDQAFTLLSEPERVGFSHKAVMHLHDLSERGPVARSDVREATRRWPRGPEHPGFAPWSAEERKVLNAAYARDLATLRYQASEPRAQLCLLDLASG